MEHDTDINRVEELKSVLKRSEKDPSLLRLIQQRNLKQRNQPRAYFSFPGTRSSMMSLPPLQKWPIQFGWSFSTWILLEPKSCAQPYLYNFKTGKSGLGYSAHFTGNCLVLSSIRVKGKGLQHCVAYEFPSERWLHCAITYHNKWRASEIKVYVNGQLAANIDMPWQVQTSEIFDKCFIGGSGSMSSKDLAGDLNCFSGQMAALYLFNEGLSPAQICALHRLGPSYMGQFKYSNESHVNLPPQICKTLYEEKLVSSLFCLFTPVAVDSGTLCIQLAPFKSSTSSAAQNYFISAPHAALQGDTKAIISQPICSLLQSLGCSRSLLPLLEVYCERGDAQACAALIGFLCDLLESSPHWFANEIVQNNGFVIVACALTNNARLLLTEQILDTFLNLTRILLTSASSPGDSMLLKHILDNILLNPSLWIYSEASVQMKLYTYLANEFLHGTRHGANRYAMSSTETNNSSSLPYMAYNPTSHAAYGQMMTAGSNGQQGGGGGEHAKSASSAPFETPSIVADLLFGEIRRVSTVLQSLHALKHYYWVTEEPNINHKARNGRLRPSKSDLMQIRSHILRFTMELIGRAQASPLDEIQGLLNYLSTCSQPENILDVIDTLSNLIMEQSTTVVIALVEKQAIRVLYTLIGSANEQVCVSSIRLLSLFLSHCSYKRKQEIMGPGNLFMLLCDRLRGHLPLSLTVYEALIDLMIEEVDSGRRVDEKRPQELSTKTIVNSTVIKVIATLVHEQRTRTMTISSKLTSDVVAAQGGAQQEQNQRTFDIRTVFINDLWNLIVNSRDNRRIILQMSVWQHWLVNLVDSTLDDSPLAKDQVLAIFRVLLYHAVRYEYGGWRVWIDTLAIIHGKVSYDEFCHQRSRDESPTECPIGNQKVAAQHEPEVASSSGNRNKLAKGPATKKPQISITNNAASTTTKATEEEVANASESRRQDQEDEQQAELTQQQQQQQQQPVCVSSISEHVLDESRGIEMAEEVGPRDKSAGGGDQNEDDGAKAGVDEPDGVKPQLASDESKHDQDEGIATDKEASLDVRDDKSSMDSIDLAPSRAYRRASIQADAEQRNEATATVAAPTPDGVQNEDAAGRGSESAMPRRDDSLSPVPLDDSPTTAPTGKGQQCDNEGELEEEAEVVDEEDEDDENEDEEIRNHADKHDTSDSVSDDEMNGGDASARPHRNGRDRHDQRSHKATASPAFRIPEFKWSSVLIKLLNDLIFSIECDLYHWRYIAKLDSLDTAPFVPRAANSLQGQTSTGAGGGGGGGGAQASGTAASAPGSTTSTNQSIESVLHKPENQIYIINVIHFVSQLADNVIISAGGLLPLLAEATGGSRGSSSESPNASEPLKLVVTREGLTMAQANSLLYRLANMVDMVVLAASHINLNELELDKSLTSGGVLRQCLRLVCTVTVKNCLLLRGLCNRMASLGVANGAEINLTHVDIPKDMFDSYLGCSLLSANSLFEQSALTLESTDLIANLEYSPHQNPNTSSMPSILPFQTTPIKDPNKLLQTIDIQRIQACIYHTGSTESRQAQFLALSSLYFVSVLMVSKYRDIIEPKQKPAASSSTTKTTTSATAAAAATSSASSSSHSKCSKSSSGQASPAPSSSGHSETSPVSGESERQRPSENSSATAAPAASNTATTTEVAISSVEANLLNFGKMQPNATGLQSASAPVTTSTLTNMLTSKLESTLDTVCPLLKTIMVDFCPFLSRTLIGSHGQDLVNREAERTFKRANASPVEVVMLLCSQEWQNTLQKNAGLAFIELINEGRVLSHGSKGHIVRVAMEAEFILSRLRADDVSKHEQFGLWCSESISNRQHEEILINSLISSAARRDYVLYCKFKQLLKDESKRNYKLDIWEDDDRRKRRFVFDSWDDSMQTFYSNKSTSAQGLDALGGTAATQGESSARLPGAKDHSSETLDAQKTETKRILDLQHSIDQGGVNDHCSPSGAAGSQHRAKSAGNESDAENYDDVGDDEDDDDEEEEEEEEEEEAADDDREDDYEEEAGQERAIAHSESENGNGSSSTTSAAVKQQRASRRGHRNHMGGSGGTGAGGPGGADDSSYRNQASDELADLAAARGSQARQVLHSDTECEEGAPGDLKTGEPGNTWDYDELGSANEFSGSVVFAAEASLIWAIYAIPGVLQISTHEVHFEPNQNISEAIDALKRESCAGKQGERDENGDRHEKGANDEEEAETALRSLRLNQSDVLGLSPEQVALRKVDLKALRYCDFLTCNGKILRSDIRAIFSRHYLLQPNALEIFVAQRTSVMFAFADFDTVKRAVKHLPPMGIGVKYGLENSRRYSLMSPRQLFAASDMTQRWQKREISNFQYLMFLNTISGRTFQDMNQYPVFPWILTDYESDELDLNLPKNFRDLSKPIGALNNKRRDEFIERYQNWDNPKVPAFHYGTHYSTAAFTLNWLCRLRGAYNSSYLALQDGKYEEMSRLFMSLGDSWVSSLSGGHQNVKELIPEFFYLPEIFHASLGLPEVELPPWAKTAEQFVRMHRIALESELVSCQLHQWIDLIFGYKQRGPEAVSAVNTFYYLTYQGNVNLNMIQEPSLRNAIETQIKHFGQTPAQLTTEPHPPRFSALHASPLVYSSRHDEINKIVKFPFNNPVVHISSCVYDYIMPLHEASEKSTGALAAGSANNRPWSVVTITSNNQYQIHKWKPDDQSGQPFTLDPQLGASASGAASGTSSSGARRQLIDVDDICSDILLDLTASTNSVPSSDSGKVPPNNAPQQVEQPQPQQQQELSQEVNWPCAHYIVTLYGKHIIMGSFYDNSFRVFATETGKLCQVIYGHRGPITCMARGEGMSMANFYIATGSQDCSLLLWHWSEVYAQVEGSGVSAVHNPLPKLSICGHQSPVLSAMICSELGLVASGSKNLVLVHNINSGENLLNINIKLPDIMDRTLREHKLIQGRDQQAASSAVAAHMPRPQVANKEKTILEASMLGEQTGGALGGASKPPDGAVANSEQSPASPAPTKAASLELVKDERLAQLKDLCRSDYYITNLRLARELAFIVCVALPPPPKKSKSSSSSAAAASEFSSCGQSPALLLTFNLRGSLMDSQPIGQSTAGSGPKLGDVCALQISDDGEHLILNDSPTTIKIYKTFGLQPLYAYNTNDLPEALAEGQNRVKSLALLDQRYILAGLENGKIIVYNCDFKDL